MGGKDGDGEETVDWEPNLDDVVEIAQAVEAAHVEAQASAKVCSEFLSKNNAAMKPPGATAEQKQTISKLMQRINKCRKDAEAAVKEAQATYEVVAARAVAVQTTQEMATLFAKYSGKQEGGQLSRKQVTTFAKEEFEFDLAKETLDSIFQTLVEDGQTGVPLEHLHLLKCAIGVARECKRDVARQKERIERDQIIADLKTAVQEKLKDVAKKVDEAEEATRKAEEDVKPFAPSATKKDSPWPEMVSLADEVDGSIEKAKASTSGVRKQINSLSDGIEERFTAELGPYVKQEAKVHDLRLTRIDSRITRAASASAKFREQANKKRTEELEVLRTKARQIIRYNQQQKEVTTEELFGLFDADGDGEINEQDFIKFFESAEREEEEEKKEDEKAKATEESVELSPDKLSCLFTYILEDGCSTITKESFMRIVRLYYKVVKQTAMTDGVNIKESKTVRRLETNEVLEVLRGPMKEDSFKMMRVQARMMNDGAEGWITVAGNMGTAFLKEGGNIFKVVKETATTDTFELEADKEATRKLKETALKKLKVGEILEVHDWPKKEEKSGLMRMRAKVKSSGNIGWVTTVGNQGTVFAEVQ